jgi:hypothetical protein
MISISYVQTENDGSKQLPTQELVSLRYDVNECRKHKEDSDTNCELE